MEKTNVISKRFGVSRRTLQYYDDLGIVSIKRNEENHRVYDLEAVNNLWKIIIYKEMGIELKEIKELQVLDIEKQSEKLHRQEIRIQEKITELKIQMKFISLIQNQGFPPLPDSVDDKTYMDYIRKMREEFKEEILKEDTTEI